jgi:phosphopantothenoylcysteine decarboxylase/phosphopantothenate--cysteine ligase
MTRVLLIVGGGIAAYKSCELVRLLTKSGHQVTPVLTKGGEHFVTPMTLGALARSPVYTSLWNLKDEVEMGHIELSRAADFLLVCPATADLLAKMAHGVADDLASTLLIATDKPVVVAPAMNVRMWQHPATRRNVEQLIADGVTVIVHVDCEMACGEFGPGRLPEPAAIVERLHAGFLSEK